MKIAIIIPYFGKWPDWIDIFFESCGANRFIDWHFFTDCETPDDKNANLYFHQMSFTDYCEQVSRRLQIDFHPSSPYKICGLRPFYAHVHKDLIVGYDFWVWGDVDVVWGDIGKFYNEEILRRYDVLSTHADRVSGHLTLIRNSDKYNNLCFQIQNWEERLTDPHPIALDEQDFSWLVYPASRYVTKFYSKVIRKLFNWRDAWVLYYSVITPVFNWVTGVRSRRLYFKEQHTTPILYADGRTFRHDTDRWMYSGGKIINLKSNKEYIYLHFMIFKKNSFRDDHFWKENNYHLNRPIEHGDEVMIDRTGFHFKKT